MDRLRMVGILRARSACLVPASWPGVGENSRSPLSAASANLQGQRMSLAVSSVASEVPLHWMLAASQRGRALLSVYGCFALYLNSHFLLFLSQRAGPRYKS